MRFWSQIVHTAFPFFVTCKRNTAALWLPCFRPFLAGTFLIFGNEVGLLHSASATTAGSKQTFSRRELFNLSNVQKRQTTEVHFRHAHRYEMIRSPLPA